ncbi:deferrochelatase/peroxidase EfeB [Serinibacter arcticus]|uniref:Deferrochelatase n=1 Tax=Serinibacter arcticus TaxID=1655435 RepID=A0A2U1ZRL2_9MICO|nr:iron uptake transporter deferrochelatase/peroxidase subunit [Serinibacter arcticus]PWD49629.1 deferrochelatase/peroxidase EfeB [Serinibacter arcticus]
MTESVQPGVRRGPSRRQALGLGAAGLAVGAVGAAAGRFSVSGAGHDGDAPHPFHGDHQAGITTPVQDHLHLASFDLSSRATRKDLVALLKDWSYAASRLTQGLDVSASGAVAGPLDAPPDDTGEAFGLPASSLTITIGLGPTLFELDGVDRFGIADRRPPGLAPLPPFLGDVLKAESSHGDLCIQACADDPQVAVHAIRNLSRIAFGTAHVRWSQMGFGRTSRTTTAQATPRNLFGFKDGTANVLADDAASLERSVWVAPTDEPAWMAGGSYLVARKIEMLMETWDRVQLGEQQTIIGRDKDVGAPLSGGEELTDPDFDVEVDGAPAIDVASHVRLAHPDNNGGAQMLRRGYNYVDGSNALGRLDAGLFFLAYVRDVEQFVTVQRHLSTDLLNEYVRHVGSATFAIPPGTQPGGWIGETLLG